MRACADRRTAQHSSSRGRRRRRERHRSSGLRRRGSRPERRSRRIGHRRRRDMPGKLFERRERHRALVRAVPAPRASRRERHRKRPGVCGSRVQARRDHRRPRLVGDVRGFLGLLHAHVLLRAISGARLFLSLPRLDLRPHRPSHRRPRVASAGERQRVLGFVRSVPDGRLTFARLPVAPRDGMVRRRWPRRSYW